MCMGERSLYVSEGLKQLSDATLYTKLERDETENIQQKIRKEVKSMVTKDELPDSAINLVVSSPKCSQFYLLPKIPKPDTPGCPVVSNVS